MENILKKIINKKKEKIINYKKQYSENEVLSYIKNYKNFINFKDKMKKNTLENKISIIAEIKKASPSAGLIIKNYDPVNIAEIYSKNNATCLSVLTEEDFFLGNLLHISKIKQKVNLPILCKDFFIDPYQVPLAKNFGADCILIILSAVDKILAKDLYQAANQLMIDNAITLFITDFVGYQAISQNVSNSDTTSTQTGYGTMGRNLSFREMAVN